MVIFPCVKDPLVLPMVFALLIQHWQSKSYNALGACDDAVDIRILVVALHIMARDPSRSERCSESCHDDCNTNTFCFSDGTSYMR